MTISPPSRPLLTAAPARPSVGKPRRKPWKISYIGEPDLHLALKCSTAPVSTAFNDLRSLLTPSELERSRTPSVWTPSPSPIYCPVESGAQKPPFNTGLLRRPLEPGQYTSIAFGLRCKEVGVRPSMGSVGDAYDNAMCESFFATLECELLDRQRFRTQAEAEMAVFDFIEGFYNPRRRHSALGQLSPVNFERSHKHEAAA